MSDQKVITRFAPSPTGLLQLGNYRTALFSYLFARQNNGQFILRIEDTDTARNKSEYEADILDSLKKLGLGYDSFFRQSEHVKRHQACLQKMIDEGKAYISQEEIKKEGDRAEVIRFKNPNRTVTFHDLIRGEVTFDTTDLKDFVIAKSLTEPVFHLAVVVDDADEGVTHVIRGEDHVSNTPRQILIQEALGFPTPVYAHLPLVLAPDRTKLSKRNGAKSVGAYLAEGYLPGALINFMAIMGWSPQSLADNADREIFSLEELVKVFDLSKVQKGGAIFNIDKLNWLNREYIKQLSPAETLEQASAFIPADKVALYQANKNYSEIIGKVLPLLIERINTFSELGDLIAKGEMDYFFIAPTYPTALLKNQTHFAKVIELLEAVSEADFTPETIKTAIWDYASEVGRGDVLWPMRIALSGQEKSPDPFTIASIVGKEETLTRLHTASTLAT